jgi:hypothetical protein
LDAKKQQYPKKFKFQNAIDPLNRSRNKEKESERERVREKQKEREREEERGKGKRDIKNVL